MDNGTGVSEPSGPKIAKQMLKRVFWGVCNFIKSPKIPEKVKNTPKDPNRCSFFISSGVFGDFLQTPRTWAVIWGSAKRMGEENVPDNALSRKIFDPSKRASGLLCRGFLYRKNRALTPEGGGKRTVRGGSKTPFGEGCHS